MNAPFHMLVSWCRDVLIAYALGLIAGAPFAVLAAWLTGQRAAATASLLLAMGAVLVGLRRRGTRERAWRPAVPAPARRQAA